MIIWDDQDRCSKSKDKRFVVWMWGVKWIAETGSRTVVRSSREEAKEFCEAIEAKENH